MATSNPEPKDVREVGSIYITYDHIAFLWQKIDFSSFDDEKEVILEVCYLVEKVNMAASDALFTSFFYIYLPNINEVGVHLFFPLQ